MLDLGEARAVLQTRGWLTRVPVGFGEEVLTNAVLRWFEKDQIVYQSGDEPGGLWGLAEGLVSVSHPNDDGDVSLASIGQVGFWTGELSVISGKPRMIGLKTLRSCTFLHVPRSTFLHIAEADPQAWRWLSLNVVEHVSTVLGHSNDLRYRRAELRVISTLLRVAGLRGAGRDSGQDCQSEIDVSQDELASFCNVSRASLTVILKDLERSGFILVQYRKLVLLDAPALASRLHRLNERAN
jgi:CRP/FNR family cyclic AMP-dependent transcriptional regulator